MAKARGVDIEQVHEWEVRTILQLVVQVLKRHRDVFFEGDPSQSPPRSC